MLKRSLVLAGLAGLLAAPVHAAVITFEGFQNTIYGEPIVRLGFQIGNVVGQEQHFHEIDSTGFGLPSNGTGVLLNDRNTEIFVRDNGGLPFTLTTVDVATALGNQPAVGIVINGYLSGSQVGQIVLPTLGNGYTTLSGASLGTIDRLVFDGIGEGGGFVLDNLALNEAPPVPEPATFALLGLGALFTVRRAARRR